MLLGKAQGSHARSTTAFLVRIWKCDILDSRLFAGTNPFFHPQDNDVVGLEDPIFRVPGYDKPTHTHTEECFSFLPLSVAGHFVVHRAFSMPLNRPNQRFLA